MEITFHGHACFELRDGDITALVDPFLAPNNPAAQVTADDVEPTHVLLTHGHGDHIADAVAIAKRTGAPCVAITELAHWLTEQGVEDVSGPNLGGTVPFDWGRVKVVPALHTNTTPDRTVMGAAAGLVIELGGVTVYHLGDTALFSDLRLIGERVARRRDRPDRRPLHDGPPRRRLRLRADRGRNGDPRHYDTSQDRDRLRRVQGRGRGGDAVRGGVAPAGGEHEVE